MASSTLVSKEELEPRDTSCAASRDEIGSVASGRRERSRELVLWTEESSWWDPFCPSLYRRCLVVSHEHSHSRVRHALLDLSRIRSRQLCSEVGQNLPVAYFRVVVLD